MASSNNADAKGSVLTKIGRDQIHSAHLQQYFKASGSIEGGARYQECKFSFRGQISNHGDNPDTSTPSSASNQSSQLASVSSSGSDIWPTDQRQYKRTREEDQDETRDMIAGKRSVGRSARVVEWSMGNWKSTLWKMKSNNRYQYNINRRVAFTRVGGGDILQLGK